MDRFVGMTVNERLFVSGMLCEFDIAVKEKNKSMITDILEKIDLDSSSILVILNTIFENKRDEF